MVNNQAYIGTHNLHLYTMLSTLAHQTIHLQLDENGIYSTYRHVFTCYYIFEHLSSRKQTMNHMLKTGDSDLHCGFTTSILSDNSHAPEKGRIYLLQARPAQINTVNFWRVAAVLEVP